MSVLLVIAVARPERFFVVKLFYENKEKAAVALGVFYLFLNLCKGQFISKALRRMIARFTKTGHLGVQLDREQKQIRSDVGEDVVTAIVEQSMDNVIGCSNARAARVAQLSHMDKMYSSSPN